MHDVVFLRAKSNILLAFSELFCFQKSADDVSNFDSEFTHEVPKLTPIDRLFLMNLDQTEFEGFSYVNPEYVQEL